MTTTRMIAYVSDDEVNRDSAARMAATCGATLHPHTTRDPVADGPFDAVVYDLESMPTRRRDAVVAGLLSARSPRPVAVHSYNLDGERDALRDHGIVVTQRLGPAMFRDLCRLIAPVPVPRAPIGVPERLVAPNLGGQITVSPLGVARQDR